MSGLVLEGVAGAGKSTVLARLVAHPRLLARRPRLHVITEERTTGELVAELADTTRTDADRCGRLRDLLPEIRSAVARGDLVILERFHPTFYALMPRWELVAEIDRELAAASFVQVLLDLPDERLAERSFARPEMASQGWSEELVTWYGSREKAIEAFARSQANRREALGWSALPCTVVDTSKRDWDRIADAVVDVLTGASG